MIAKRMCDFFATILVSGILYTGCLSPDTVQAQNTTCTTRPVGDNSNACASTAFVNNQIALTISDVANIAALRALPAPSANVTTYVIGYTTSGDGGEGFFTYNTTSAAVDNAGTIIRPDSLPALGRWIREVPIPGRYSVKWFGAKGDGIQNDGPLILKTVNAAGPNGANIILPQGTYLSGPSGGFNGNCFPLVDFYSVKIEGTGAVDNAFSSGTNLVFTGATGSIMSLDGVEGIEISNLFIRYNNPAYNGDLIDARKITGGILSNSIHFHNFAISGTQGVATSANSLIRVGNTLKVHMHDGFMQYALRGFHNDATQPVNDVELHVIWWQDFSSQPITMAGNAWNIHDNAVEPLTTGVAPFDAGWIVLTNPCFGCNVSTNNIGDSNTSGTWIDASAFPFLGGTVNSNLITNARAVNWGTSSGVTSTGNSFDYPVAFQPFVAGSATNMNITANYCHVQTPPGTCTIFQGGAYPTASVVDNNDGLGTRIAKVLLTTPLAETSGGTGKASYAIGDLLYADSTTTLARLADIATTNVLISGGIGAPPSWGKVGNSALTNSSTTVNGVTCTLGSTCTVLATASSLVVGTTAISGGSTTRILYNNASVLGEYTISGSGTTVAMNTGPSISGPTFTSTVTATGLIKNSDLATMVTNTVKGNATSGTAAPTDLAMTSCSTAASAVIWTTNTGFGCNTSITATTNANLTGAVTSVGNATLLGSFTSANLAGALTDETGTGAAVFGTSPTLVSPIGIISMPGGRLTLATGTPVMSTTTSAITTTFYTAYINDRIPIYNGTNWLHCSFSEISNINANTVTGSAGPAAVTTNSNYDYFVWSTSSDCSNLTLTRGPLWTSDTARGSGAGTTQITRAANGILTNTVAITNGPTAGKGTYVGTMRSNGSSQFDYIFGASAAGGTAGFLGVWNMYNRIDVKTTVTDSTASWTYATNTIRALDNSNGNRVSFISGLAEEGTDVTVFNTTDVTGGVAVNYQLGMALDATNALDKINQLAVGTGLAGTVQLPVATSNSYAPQLGFHFIQATERTAVGSATPIGGAFEGLIVRTRM